LDDKSGHDFNAMHAAHIALPHDRIGIKAGGPCPSTHGNQVKMAFQRGTDRIE
jgi:hypothetical protein